VRDNVEVSVTKRLAAIPGWPYSPAAVLAVAAVTEVLVRGNADGLALASTIVLAVATTAPVAWVAAHWLAPVAITLAAVVALAFEGRLTIAGIISVVVTFYVVARIRPAWQVAVLAIPLVVVAFGYLVAESGPATDDIAVSEDSTIGAEPLELPEPPELPGPAGVLDEPDDGINAYPLLVAALALGGAGTGLIQRTRSTEVRLVESEASVADVTLAHSAQGERVRIARELHDVVAHRITSIAVQAETARLTTPGLPDDGAQRLAEIGDSARDALDEMRRLLGVLRKDGGAAERTPQPGIAELNALVHEARSLSAASVRLTFSGHVAPLDPALELTAYRIVQEALTNARRHAPGAAVDVEVAYGDSELRVEIRDTGGSAASAAADGGHGLLGMRERVAMAGGELSVGSSSFGGFVVTATLPRAERGEAGK
jgi:signal transduction histidine kinase